MAEDTENLRRNLLRIKDPEYEGSSSFQNLSTFRTTRRHVPEYKNLHGDRRKDLHSSCI